MIALKKILWPTDFSGLSMKAGKYTREPHRTFQGELHILHVLPATIVAPAAVDEATGALMVGELDTTANAARERLQRFVAEELQNDRAVVCEVRIGGAWHEICAYAQEVGAALIVIGTHGLTGFRHILIGSTAERVVQHAGCPVLTVKSLESDFLQTKSSPQP